MSFFGLDFFGFNIVTIIAIGVGILVVVVLIALFVWGHKTNVQTETLKSIDETLKNGVDVSTGSPAGEGLESLKTAEQEAAADDQAGVRADQGSSQDILMAFAKGSEGDDFEMEKRKRGLEDSLTYNRGKSGKVYSREDLVAQIKN